MTGRRRWAALIGATLATVAGGGAVAHAFPFGAGDVFLSYGEPSGDYAAFDDAAAPLGSVSMGSSGNAEGCATDAVGNLLAADFSHQSIHLVSAAEPHAQLRETPSVTSTPETIVPLADGGFVVGSQGPLERYDAAGRPVQAMSAITTTHIEVARDQRTVYAAAPTSIDRYDLGSPSSPPVHVATVSGDPRGPFDLRLLPPGDGGGGLLVANGAQVRRYDAAANLVQTYSPGSAGGFERIALAPDGTSFWAVDSSGSAYRIDLYTGDVLAGPTPASVHGGAGLCVEAEPEASHAMMLGPAAPHRVVGTGQGLIASFPAGTVAPGQSVLFAVAGANPATRVAKTDADGEAGFTDNGTQPGVDDVTACGDLDESGTCDPGEPTARTAVTWEAPATITVDDVSVREGDTGTTPMTFTISLSAPAAGPVTVDYRTADGTADASDYVPTSGTVTFAPGEQAKPVTVQVRGDTTYEADETLSLVLSSRAPGRSIADGTGVGTIVNDDPIPTTLAVHPALATIGVNNPGAFSIPLGPSATLTALGGVPLAGRTITFTTGGRTICQAVTAADGKAACTGLVPRVTTLLSGTYTGTFAGDGTYAASTGTANLVGIS